MAYRFNPFTSQLDFYQEDTQFVSSGGIANLTSGQQDQIREGSIVTTTDGRRWAYSGTGSKTLEASYVELADITPEWSVIAGKPAIPTAAPAAGQIMAGNAGGTAFATVSVSGDATLAATGALTISAGAIGTSKLGGDITTAGKDLLDDANAAAQRSTLGLGNSSTLNVGSTTGTVAAGDDSRLSDARTPTSHTHGNITNDGKIGTTSGLPVVTTTSGTLTTLPLGTAGQALVVNSGATALEFAAPAAGIGGTVGTVDNAVPRADGTGGYTVQGSGLIVEDAIESFTSITGDAGTDVITATGSAFANGQPIRFTSLTGGTGLNTTTNYFVREVSGATFKVETSIGGGAINFTTNITAGTLLTGHSVSTNVTLSENTTATNSDLVLTPKGTGALIAGPKPDGTSTGGNARGARAVDLQLSRTGATQVASGARAFLGAGENNSALGPNNVVCGGSGNTAQNSGLDAFPTAICGGGNNNASNFASFIGGGHGNVASGRESAICGGRTNSTASSEGGFVGGGYTNSASANGAVVAGGGSSVGSGSAGNISSGVFSGNLSGSSGRADRYGMQSHANGAFASASTSGVGDAQRARFVLRCKTTTNAAVEMALDGGTTYLGIPSGKVIACTINISGVKSDGSAVAHYVRQYAVKNVGGTSSEVYAPVTIGTDNAAGTVIALSANNTDDTLRIAVTGIAAETWRWVASVDAVEIAYGT